MKLATLAIASVLSSIILAFTLDCPVSRDGWRCLWLFHRWRPFKHGPDLSPYPDWDGRECGRCGTTQIIRYGYWHTVAPTWPQRKRYPA